MEEEEIEIWYEEEKQMLSEQYIKAIERGMSLDDREKKFTHAMENLNRKYEKRHNAFRNGKERKESTQIIINIILTPFRFLKEFFIQAGKGFGIIGAALKSKGAQANFHISILWIKNAYKVPDNLRSWTMPLYIFYTKHIQMPLIILAKPFVRLGRFISSCSTDLKTFITETFKAFLKYAKISGKYIAARLSGASKKISARMADWAKKLKERKAKQVQAQIDRRQKKKEEKEKKTGKKEAAPQLQTV